MKQTIVILQGFLALLAVQCSRADAANVTIDVTTETARIDRTVNSSSETTTTTTKYDDSTVPVTRTQQPLSTLMCEKRDRPYFLPHKSEPSKFFVCVKGQLFLLNCPSEFRFDSQADQCTRQTTKENVVEKPKKPVLMPHETNCGWYYIVRPENNGERVLNSCPMPQLFDMVTFECRNYTEVKCKDRFEPKDACDYQIRSSAHAYPCSYMPSCKTRPDGLYPDRLRDCRMYFRCTAERSSESYSCAQDTLPLGERFSFEEQRCLPAQYVECVNDLQKPFF